MISVEDAHRESKNNVKSHIEFITYMKVEIAWESTQNVSLLVA